MYGFYYLRNNLLVKCELLLFLFLYS